MNSTSFALALLACFLAGFLPALLLTALARPTALRIGFTDKPGGHKSHARVTPYGGGSAMFLALLAVCATALIVVSAVSDEWLRTQLGETFAPYVGGLRLRVGQAAILLAGAAVLHILGLIDDVRPLGPFIKLSVMIGVALGVSVWGELRIASFLGAPLSLTLTVLWYIVITNSFNFLDNMDGLSGGVAMLCAIFLAFCGVLAHQALVPAFGLLLAGVIGGFLVFNFPPARIFMGDAGSLVLGYMLASLSILTSYYESAAGAPPYPLAMPLVVLAVPLYDFVSVVIIRMLEGRNPFRGDQRHFSHRLVDRGLSRRSAVLTIYLATATTGLAATLLPRADARQTITVLAITLMVLAVIAILEAPLRKKP